MLHDLLMALRGIPGGFFEMNASDGVTFCAKSRQAYCVFIGNGEIDIVNKLLEFGTIRAKLALAVDGDIVDESDDVYVKAFRCGIQDALHQYDLALVAIETEYLSGREEKLAELYAQVEPWRRTLTTLLNLVAKVEVEQIRGAILLDHLNALMEGTLGDQMVHDALAHVLCQVEFHLFNHLGKWLILGEYTSSFFIVRDEETDQPRCEMNQLPRVISDDILERILLIGSSLLMLKSKKIDHGAYSVKAYEMFNQLYLAKGEMDELPMVSPCKRIKWRSFDKVIHELEDNISAYVWEIFITKSNLIKEIAWLKDVYLLKRGDLHSTYYDFVQALASGGAKVPILQMSIKWQKSLDLVGLYHLDDTFAVTLKKQEIKREFIDAYQGAKHTIWSQMYLTFVGDQQRIFVKEQSVQFYRAAYRLLVRIRNCRSQLHKMTMGRHCRQNDINLGRFQIDGFLAQLEQYIDIEVLETEWASFAQTLGMKRFRAVSKGHFKYVTNVSRKLFLHDAATVARLLVVLSAVEAYAAQPEAQLLQKFNLAHNGLIDQLTKVQRERPDAHVNTLLAMLGGYRVRRIQAQSADDKMDGILMNAADNQAASVVTLVMLRSYYEFHASLATSEAKMTISKVIYSYTKSSKDVSLAERFAKFKEDVTPASTRFYDVVVDRLFDLLEDGSFIGLIFHNFSKRVSIADTIGLDVDKQNSYFGILMRQLLCSLQELDPSDVIQIKQALVTQLKEVVPNYEMDSTQQQQRSRRISSTGMMLVDDTDEFGCDGLSELSLYRVKDDDPNDKQKGLLDFMKSNLNCGVHGYKQVYELLVQLEQNVSDRNETKQFVHYMAALEFHDAIGVWEAFTLYAFDSVIKRELSSILEKTEEGGSVSSDALRCLSLTMSSLFIYFGYNKAGSRSLAQAKHLAYCNNDVETLNLVLLWQANIGEVEIPAIAATLPTTASKSLRAIKQKQQLQLVKHELAKNEPLKQVLNRVNTCLANGDKRIDMGTLAVQMLIKSHIYAISGRAPLAELCAQIVLSLAINEQVDDRREIEEARAHAAEIIKSGVSTKWSGDLSSNVALMEEWDSLVRSSNQLIFQRKRPLIETHGDAVELYLTKQQWQLAEQALERFNQAKCHETNPVIKQLRSTIFKCRLLIGRRRLAASLADQLVNVVHVAKRNGFGQYALEANLALAQFWVLTGQSRLVQPHLAELDDDVRLAGDHYSLKIIALYQLAAHIVQHKNDKSQLNSCRQELEDLTRRLEQRGNEPFIMAQSLLAIVKLL